MIAEPSPNGQTGANTNAWEFDERYVQRHSLQIALCLRSLMSRGDFLTVEFDGAQFVTQLLDVDARRLQFLFDYGSVQDANAALPRADKLTFRSQPSGIRTEFATGRAITTTFEGRPAFAAPFPELLHYVQRRDYYRVDTPLLDPFVASGVDAEGVAFQLDVQDLSLSGIALRTRDVRFESVAPGSAWKDVSVRLGALGAVSVDLEIAAPRPALTPTGERRFVLGCRFIDLKGHAERALQRAITTLEARRQGRSARA